ncbi:MAG: hypothetical protein GY842_08455 [bacterium]|nr:hypothetical protein [bacterium]
MARIGIRREDKSQWEGRAPLVPDHVGQLAREHGIQFAVESSPTRAFSDAAYATAGATVGENLDDCPIILGIKEIPLERLEANRTYVYFSHTIKGQAANMPALRRLLDLGSQLIDYERIVDDRGRRMVLFGPFAGQAGMIDSLWALGRRLEWEGTANPFSAVQPAHRYADLTAAKHALARVGETIRREGLPPGCPPMVCGFAGYGAVSGGAQEVYDCLPVEEVTPKDLASLPVYDRACFKVVFKEEHMAERVDASAPFGLQEYYDHPERYRGIFAPYLEHLTLLVNCIYWEPRYPRLVTKEVLSELYSGPKRPRLRVIGDVTCDVEGSIECTTHCTTPDSPVYVYDPSSGQTHDGVEGQGPVILAVDFLPCELPIDSSNFFSTALKPLVSALARADFSAPLDQSGLPAELQRATIVYQGELTESYRHLQEHLA